MEGEEGKGKELRAIIPYSLKKQLGKEVISRLNGLGRFLGLLYLKRRNWVGMICEVFGDGRWVS